MYLPLLLLKTTILYYVIIIINFEIKIKNALGVKNP